MVWTHNLVLYIAKNLSFPSQNNFKNVVSLHFMHRFGIFYSSVFKILCLEYCLSS